MRSAARAPFVVACVLVALSQSARAQPAINYPNFLFNAPFQDNGNAQGVNFNTLLMTTDGNQNSSTFVIATQDLTQSFTAQFSFYMGSGSFGVHTTNGTGPGGIAFVIEGDSRGATALGGGGDQLGYGDGIANSGQAIQHSVALTYSTFGGSDQFQIFTNTTNSNLNTQSGALATQSGSQNLSNVISQMTVNYEAPDISFPNGALTVLLNGNPIGLNNVALPASLSSLAGSNMGYFGFTASTGGATGTGPEIYVGSLVAGPPVPEPATGLLFGILGIAWLPQRRAHFRA